MKKIKEIVAIVFKESGSADVFHGQNKNPDKKVFIICTLVAFCLTMNKYISDVSSLYALLDFFGREDMSGQIRSSHNEQIIRLSYWVFILCVFYFIVPCFTIWFVFKEALYDYGLRLKGAFKDSWLYAVMLAVMIPLVAFFSTTASFQAKYPFYDLAPGENLFPNFWIWEALYFIQFFSLEFFFRGFMTHGLKHRFGFYSVFVMVIPYCMIHFGKPLPETIAAIVAGIVLGALSLKSRSILLGVAIHYSVGLLMDLFALWQK